MKRAAIWRYLMLAVIAWAMLFLPWGSLAPAGGQKGCCPHGQWDGVSIASGQCCCPSGVPGQCGCCGHNGMSLCRCSSGSPAFIIASAAPLPTWPASPYMQPPAGVALKVFPPNIFHPPELRPGSLPA